jgi:hypothetical protein
MPKHSEEVEIILLIPQQGITHQVQEINEAVKTEVYLHPELLKQDKKIWNIRTK